MTASPSEEFEDVLPTMLATLERESFESHAADEGVIFFCVENAPAQSRRAIAGADGSLTFHTELRGLVLEVEANRFVMRVARHLVEVRHLLPTGVGLEGLAGRRIVLDLRQVYRGRGRATIDCEVRDLRGRQILWAHDGRFPDEAAAHGLTLLASHPAPTNHDGQARLAVRGSTGSCTLACPGTAAVSTGGREFTLALVRLGIDDVSFVLLRR